MADAVVIEAALAGARSGAKHSVVPLTPAGVAVDAAAGPIKARRSAMSCHQPATADGASTLPGMPTRITGSDTRCPVP